MRIFKIIEGILLSIALGFLAAKCITPAIPSPWLFFSFVTPAAYYLLFGYWIFPPGKHKYRSILVSILASVAITLCLLGWMPDVFSWPNIFPFFLTGVAVATSALLYELILRNRLIKSIPSEGRTKFRKALVLRLVAIMSVTGFLAVGPRDIVYTLLKMKNTELRLFEYVGKLLESKDTEKASAVMKRQFSHNDLPEVRRLFGEVLLANGDTAGAINKFQLSLLNDTFDHAIGIAATNLAAINRKDKYRSASTMRILQTPEPNYSPYNLEDGWESATPASQSVSNAVLLKYFTKGESIPSLVGLMVVKNDKIIAEKYYQSNPLHLNPTFSVWKSIVSTMCGAALANNYIKSVDQKLPLFFPEYPYEKNDPRRNITIRHLLTMTSGITGNDYGKYWNEKDPLHTILDNPVNSQGHFFYLTQNMILTLKIIERTSGLRFDKFCQRICDTMKILQPYYPDSLLKNQSSRVKGGASFSWDGTYLTLRDMAKFGLLFLHYGNYKGCQVVPREWMLEATKEQYTFDAAERKDYTSGYDGYGYYFWIKNIAGHHAFISRGWGGQTIVCVPDKQLMLLSFGNEWDKSGGFAIERLVLSLTDEIINNNN